MDTGEFEISEIDVEDTADITQHVNYIYEVFSKMLYLDEYVSYFGSDDEGVEPGTRREEFVSYASQIYEMERDDITATTNEYDLIRQRITDFLSAEVGVDKEILTSVYADLRLFSKLFIRMDRYYKFWWRYEERLLEIKRFADENEYNEAVENLISLRITETYTGATQYQFCLRCANNLEENAYDKKIVEARLNATSFFEDESEFVEVVKSRITEWLSFQECFDSETEASAEGESS